MRTILKASIWLMTSAMLGLAATASGDSVEREVPADPAGEVEIVNVSGDVQVSGWDRPKVKVVADLGDSVERLDVQSTGKRISIRVVLRDGSHSDGSSDLIVQVPRDSALSVNTVSAEQTIAGVRGAQRLQAVSGAITTQIWTEEISAKSISGDIIIDGHGGSSVMAVNTVSGDITLRNAAGDLTVETVTGDMQIDMPSLVRGRLRTTNGDLHLRTALARDARLDAEGINGDLRFLLRQPLDVEFDVETFNGEIDNCFGPKSVRTHEFAPGNALRFKEGAGNARVRIKTLNGGVEICK
jgi:DUF4097 and DUF4098 domain-containing protein YvlB